MRKLLIACTVAALAASAVAQVRVDCAKPLGSIRALHGGNCGPIQDGGMIDLSDYFRQMGIPFIRLHDCHWPNPDVVDIHAIFPDMKADPLDPRSYDFQRTDDYLQTILKTGSKIVYRLGESIEHTPRKYHVHPPADYDRWAAVCIGIIRHYNEGWAGGFRHDIRYWEIWNEPENRPAMWTGTDDDYLRLYETTAKAIKARWPGLKVGGPSLGYTGKLANGKFEAGEFVGRFLDHCRQQSSPLDFFSWHLYTDDPTECLVRAKGIRAELDRRGFTKAESHFNEWSYLPNNDWEPMMLKGQGRPRQRFYEQMSGPAGAAFTASVLMNLQDSSVDVANYYRSDSGGFGLFTSHGTPTKAFYAMKAFRGLLDTPLRVEAAAGRLAACAGTNEGKSAVHILISNLKADERLDLTVTGLGWKDAAMCSIFAVDATHDFESIRETSVPAGDVRIKEDLKAPWVCLVRLTK